MCQLKSISKAKILNLNYVFGIIQWIKNRLYLEGRMPEELKTDVSNIIWDEATKHSPTKKKTKKTVVI